MEKAKQALSLFRKQWIFHLMLLPAIVWLFLFAYMPMVGLQISFKDYMFNKGIWGSPFVGLKHFRDFLIDPNLITVLKNTFGISLMKLFFMFPAPIVLALLLNEVKNLAFKKVTQTVSYFPYFISWVMIALMAQQWFSANNGFINNALVSLGVLKEPFLFLGEPRAFWSISLFLDIWKNIGYGSIIYLAAIAGIDPTLYEAAEVDGAKKLHKIVHITLPGIAGTVIIMFILNIGSMLSGGSFGSNFQISYLLGNPLNITRSEILDTYILKIGFSLGRYSFASAVGLLQSIVSFILLLSTNMLSRRITGESFF